MSGLVHTLQHPITLVSGDTVSELRLRRSRVGDLKEMERAGGGDIAKTALMIGRLSGLAPVDVDKIDAVDFNALGLAMVDFTQGSPTTGTT